MELPKAIDSWGNAIHKITSSERWAFVLIMLFCLVTIIFLVIYFLNSIQEILIKHQAALDKQRTEYIQTNKEMRLEFTQAINNFNLRKP